jgi:NAD(P)-dependent dehydrogenase (short-subunit alcohol dehydrogenase family)
MTRKQANKPLPSWEGMDQTLAIGLGGWAANKELQCSNAQFVKCDVRNWDDQVAVFEAAVANSPDKSCDIVISNAGIIVPDDMFKFDGKHTRSSYS